MAGTSRRRPGSPAHPGPGARTASARAAVLGVLAAAALFAGCFAEERPNLVLISIDTLRADHLSAYGYSRPTSPHIDRLASEGLLFERAWSPANWTLPSHATMLTGLYPHEHAVERIRDVVHEEIELLPEALAGLGYRSAGVVSTVPFLTRRHGFDQGWSVYDDRTAYPRGRSGAGLYGSSPEFVSSPIVHRRALELLDELAPGPFFLFLHYFDAHSAYLPPPPHDRGFGAEERRPRLELGREDEPRRAEAERRAALYDGEIRWVDGWIGRLLDELERRGLARRTVVVLTSDHGEEFLEHSRWEHHDNGYDTSLRVPLIVRLPDGRGAGTRSRATVGLADVAATLLAAAGRRQPTYASGRDLVTLAAAPADGGREVLIRTERSGRSGRFLAGIVSGGVKALFDTTADGRATAGAVGLYAIDRDRFERRDLQALEPRLLGELRARTDRALAEGLERGRRAPQEPERELDREEEDSLRALGYL